VLCLASNKLVDMPVEIGRLTRLKFMELAGNQVSNIPVELLAGADKELAAMKKVEKSEEDTPRLHGDLIMPEILRERDALLASIASWETPTQVLVTYFQRLDYAQTHIRMDMSGLGLEALQTAMLGFTHLTSLNLGDNKIKQLPLALAFMTSLREVNLAGNLGIDWMPAKILSDKKETIITMFARLCEGSMTEDLDMSDLHLRLVPACVFELETVTSLNLSRNGLIALPSEFGFLRSFDTLTTLDASNNVLRTLPESIGELTGLRNLHLSFNDLRYLPPELSACTLLTDLTLANNPALESPPPAVVDAGVDAVLAYLQQLHDGRERRTFDLEGRGFYRVPVDLTKYMHVVRLNLSRNSMLTLPVALCQLKNLECLLCAHNRLDSLPEGIGLLLMLKELMANDNRCVCVYVCVYVYVCMCMCVCVYNTLDSLPEGIGLL
jgi:internalin A